MKLNFYSKNPLLHLSPGKTDWKKILNKQNFLVMKLIFLLLTVTCLQIRAESYAQQVTLHNKDIALGKVFEQIYDQTGFQFVCTTDMLKEAKKVSINVKNVPLEEVLEISFRDQPLTYTIRDKAIIVKRKENQQIRQVQDLPPIRINGKVTDSLGNPLIGVTVKVKGGETGTVTDGDGNYFITVPEDAVLEVSYVGYQLKEVPVNGREKIDVVLSASVSTLNQLVVVGYGTQKIGNVTGAIDVVSAKQLENKSEPTLSQMLMGQSPGLGFSVDQKGFEPGASVGVNVRGIGSINGGSPYVLIDGFPGSMDNLDPNNIESISILKDAASSAIYGAKAAYGVILITTKSGNKDGKIKVQYSGQMIYKTHETIPHSLNSYIWSKVMNEAGNNSGGEPMSHQTIDMILQYQNKDYDALRQEMPFWPEGATVFGAYPVDSLHWDHANLGYANNDWWDILFGHSVHQKHNLSISGGSKNATYYFSGGYLDDGSILNFGKNDYRRVNLLGKVDFNIKDWWKVSFETRATSKTRVISNLKQPFTDYDIFQQFTGYGYPFAPEYDGWGHYLQASQIPQTIYGGDNTSNQFLQSYIIKTQLNPVKGWEINAAFSYDRSTYTSQDNHLPIPEPVPRDPDERVILGASLPSSLTRTESDALSWSTNIYSSYNKSFGKHNFYIMGGMQLTKGRTNGLIGSKTDIITREVPSLQTATGQSVLTGALDNSATAGFFSRFTYNYNEKYFLEVNDRYDGSYVFGAGHRWGFFPSFSMGWRLDNENFWESIKPVINTMKLRGSWGELGNQNIAPYSDLSLIPLHTDKLPWIFGYGSSEPLGYTTAPNLTNVNLTWETSITTDVGMDLSLLNNRLTANLDLFSRKTKNMVGATRAVPGVLGVGVPKENNADLDTRGWEMQFNWRQQQGSISYYVGLNISNSVTKITKYLNPTGSLSTWYKGERLGDIWGYTAHDLFRTKEDLDNYLKNVDLSFISTRWNTGDVKYLDINNDGKVDNGKNTVDDHGDLSVIGNNQPRYVFGISAGFSYKNFDFSMLWDGIGKRDMYIDQHGDLYWGFSGNWWEDNLTASALDYYRDEPGTHYRGLYEGDKNINTGAFWPRPYTNPNDIARNTLPTTRYLANLAYIRLKNIQIGYSLPKELISRVGIEELRVFISGDNILTFDHLNKGLDPFAIYGSVNGVGLQNVAGRLTYGATRNFTMGLNLTF